MKNISAALRFVVEVDLRRRLPRFVGAAIFAGLLCCSEIGATVRLPEALGDHMVLQQNSQVTLWGWAFAGEKVEVETSWGVRTSIVADSNGCWRMKVQTPAAQPLSQGLRPEHITFTVPNENAVQIRDILIGEVWLCSGQSNMDIALRPGYPAGWGRWYGESSWQEESKHADRPGLRLFNLARAASAVPQADCRSTLMSQGFDPRDENGLMSDSRRGWVVCDSQTAPYFHAVPYYFGAALQEKLGIPVGLVTPVVGGTAAESWMSIESVRKVPAFENASAVLLSPFRGTPACLYNGMIAPLTPMTIKGVTWYQGEGNVDRPSYAQYLALFTALIADWRRAFENEKLPFYFVQIAPCRRGFGLRSAQVREAQASALVLPYTGMALSIDVGEVGDIHPRDKRTIGWRLAAQALAKTYGFADIEADGPTAEALTAGGNTLRVRFRNTMGGLFTRDRQPPNCFEVAGVDGTYVPAEAILEGDEVVVKAAGVTDPRSVRFAWGEADIPNLTGRHLPVPQFRLDLPAPDRRSVSGP